MKDLRRQIAAKVVAIDTQNGKTTVALDQTPFYAESGGQVGDIGVMSGENGSLTISDTQKNANKTFLHMGQMTGEIKAGETVQCQIDLTRRAQITRHHTLAHLFLGAAKQVLDDTVKQAGSHLDENRLRFDFTWPRALTAEEITKIENLVQASIMGAADVVYTEKPINEAKAEGVEATFGENYGDIVRTVMMGEYSYELCGGTHVKNTAEVGACKITSESGVAAGIRRIEMVAGSAAQQLLQNNYCLIGEIGAKLKASRGEELARLDSVFAEHKAYKKQLAAAQGELAAAQGAKLAANALEHNGLKTVVVTDSQLDGKAIGNLARSILKEGISDSYHCQY